jgi:hypothetical protein
LHVPHASSDNPSSTLTGFCVVLAFAGGLVPDYIAALRAVSILLIALSVPTIALADPLVYEGSGKGAGQGKHIVFLAGDHEYRSEETLPALARILAQHHGFKCTVLFTVDPSSGEIIPGCNHLPGTEALQSADLMVIFLRFQDLPKTQMQPIVDYLDRAGPVVGL